MALRDRERRMGYFPKHRLCGGTFLYVVLQAISNKAKRRGTNNEGIRESTCFVDLIKLGQKIDVYGDPDTIRQETSKYKYCKIEATSWMPFTDEGYVNRLKDKIENDLS